MDILPSTRVKQQIKSLFLLYLFVARTLGNCPRPEPKDNIVLTNESLLRNEYPDGIQITLTCANGYVHDGGSATMMCTDGAWGSPDLTCKKKDCGQPVPKPHMTFDISKGTFFGAVATVICDKGYSVRGSAYKQCYNSGWTGKTTKCLIVTCEIPKEITNGKSSWNSDNNPKYEDIITYTCDEGYTINGTDKIVCTEDGEYDSEPPQCLGVTKADVFTTKTVSTTTPTSTPPTKGVDIFRDADTTTTTITPSKPHYPQGDQNNDIVDTKKDGGYTSVIISVVCVTLVVCIAVLFINKLLNKRKGSYDTREDLKPELLQFQNL